MSKCNCGGTTPPPVPTRHRTLRLALAMRGGVSLAVWIGGAVAEIDLFRRACNTNAAVPPAENDRRQARAKTYVDLLKRTKYKDVRVDILAGASAGGLNAVLFGLAQTCGAVMDEPVRATWIEEGGIWDLLWDPGFGRIPSILKGDGQFFDVVRKALNKVANPDLDHQAARARRVTVELAATLLDDDSNPARGNRARFSFTKTPGDLTSKYTTIPRNDDGSVADRRVALDCMALAARSTSSFPGAFEPADIYSYQASRSDEPGSGCTVNMSRAFLYSRPLPDSSDQSLPDERQEPFNVVDGGIFDNIPIDRAIRAIQRAPASQPSERRLIYLDPEPPTPREPITDRQERYSAASWLPVILSSRSLQQREETASDELARVREHNDEVMQARGRLEALAATLRRIKEETSPGDPINELDTMIRDKSYHQCRIANDAPRIANLLTDPWSELCQPPREAIDYEAIGPKEAVQIKKWTLDAYNEDPDSWKLSDDVYAMLDRVGVLIALVQALEGLLEKDAEQASGDPATPPPPPPPLAGQLKRWKELLYRCLTVLIEAKHIAVDTVLAHPLRTGTKYDGDTLRAGLLWSRYYQKWLTPPFHLLSMLTAANTEAPADRDLYHHLATWLAAPVVIGAPTLEASLTPILETLYQEIRTDSNIYLATLPTGERDWLKEWRESVFPHFYFDELLSGFCIQELSKLFAITGIPSTASIIAYHEITSDEAPAIDVGQLAAGAKAKQLGAWLRHRPKTKQMRKVLGQPDRLIGADAKLAGNVLSRFGGFFRARWRENDWQWGRLDAAAGIARVLNATRSDPIPDCVLERDFIGPLQQEILDESQQTVKSNQGLPIVQSVGAETFDAVSPHYRFALASRIVPLVYRALLPSKESRTSVGGILSRALLYGVRPLAVPLPLLADTLRFAFAAVVILGSAALLGASPSGQCWIGVYSVILGVAAVIIGWRTVKAFTRWKALSEQLGEVRLPLARDWKEFVDVARKDKTRYFVYTAVMLAVVVGFVIAHWVLQCVAPQRASVVPLEAFVVAVLFLFGSQYWLNQQIHRMSSGTSRSEGLWRVILRFAAVGLATCVALLAEYIANHTNTIPWYIPPAPIVAAAAVALLTGISLWRWVRNEWVVICVVVGAALGGLTQWGLEAWLDWGTLDLLPTFVWMLGLGIVGPRLPVLGSDKNYGETDVPRIVPLRVAELG